MSLIHKQSERPQKYWVSLSHWSCPSNLTFLSIWVLDEFKYSSKVWRFQPFQKTVIVMLITVRTWNLPQFLRYIVSHINTHGKFNIYTHCNIRLPVLINHKCLNLETWFWAWSFSLLSWVIFTFRLLFQRMPLHKLESWVIHM